MLQGSVKKGCQWTRLHNFPQLKPTDVLHTEWNIMQLKAYIFYIKMSHYKVHNADTNPLIQVPQLISPFSSGKRILLSQ